MKLKCTLGSLFVSLHATALAGAQAPQWSTDFAPRGVLGASAVAAFDDGNGTALYVAHNSPAAGDVTTGDIAKWDGTTWGAFASRLEGGFSPIAGSLAVFDAGSGAELYIGGGFNSVEGVFSPTVARWSAGQWRALDNINATLSGSFATLHTADVGAGQALYASFSQPVIVHGGSTLLARWDGTTWTSVGAITSGTINDVTAFDDGSGVRLFAAGNHLEWGAGPASVAAWDGTSWSHIAGPTNLPVAALEVFDDGGGPALYVGGSFTSIAGAPLAALARFDGTQWSSVGAAFAASQTVARLSTFDDGSGARLIAAGRFTALAGTTVHSIASWDGTHWSALGSGQVGIATSTPSTMPLVSELATFDLGDGPRLCVAGGFSRAGANTAANIAHWNGTSWGTFGDGQGLFAGMFAGSASAQTIARFDGEVFVGGAFAGAGDVLTSNLARWNGNEWNADDLAADGRVFTLFTHDDGSGEQLYAGGEFSNIGSQSSAGFARWNGIHWSPVIAGAEGASASVFAQAEYDDGTGTALFVGGEFNRIGGVFAKNIAKWDGTAWTNLGPAAILGEVYAMVAHDDRQGAGRQLYVGGSFSWAGGQSAIDVARWNGSSWSPVGDGLSARVRAFAVFDVGQGEELYAGGDFTGASTLSVHHIAKWNGVSWQPVGAGFDNRVEALCVHDDGFGPALLAGGSFLNSGGTPMRRLARWNGAHWSEFGGGAEANVRALHSIDDGFGFGTALYAAGDFHEVGGVASLGVARHARTTDAETYCTSGTTSSGCSPTMQATGSASASGASEFVITAAQLEGAKSGHMFYGVNGAHAAPWGQSSHFLCVKSPTQRTGSHPTGGFAGQCDGALVLDWNAYIASHPNALGVPFSAGQTVWAQSYFRDPSGPKTTALSNGLRFQIAP